MGLAVHRGLPRRAVASGRARQPRGPWLRFRPRCGRLGRLLILDDPERPFDCPSSYAVLALVTSCRCHSMIASCRRLGFSIGSVRRVYSSMVPSLWPAVVGRRAFDGRESNGEATPGRRLRLLAVTAWRVGGCKQIAARIRAADGAETITRSREPREISWRLGALCRGAELYEFGTRGSGYRMTDITPRIVSRTAEHDKDGKPAIEPAVGAILLVDHPGQHVSDEHRLPVELVHPNLAPRRFVLARRRATAPLPSAGGLCVGVPEDGGNPPRRG